MRTNRQGEWIDDILRRRFRLNLTLMLNPQSRSKRLGLADIFRFSTAVSKRAHGGLSPTALGRVEDSSRSCRLMMQQPHTC